MANVQLAKNLKTLRKKYNYTQQDVSTFLNITRQAYSHYEQALREPDLNTLVSSLPILSGHFGRTYCRQHSCRPDPGIYAHL